MLLYIFITQFNKIDIFSLYRQLRDLLIAII